MRISNYKIILLFFSLFSSSLCLINQDELVKQLLYLVNKSSDYSNVPGQNMMNYIGGKFYCDCSGMIEALLNGYDIYNVKEGSKLSTYPVTQREMTSKDLIDGCEDISEDFDKLFYAPVLGQEEFSLVMLMKMVIDIIKKEEIHNSLG